MNSYSPFNQLVEKMAQRCQPSFTEREAERMDRELRKTGRSDRILRELERADRASGETASRMLPKSPLDPLVNSQEVLARLAREVLTPRTDLIPRPLPPPAFSDPMQALNDLRIPVKSLRLKFPEFPKSYTLAQLELMSDDEIRTVLGENVSLITVQLARHVREMRQLERMSQPHWSTNWMFWLGVAGVIIAVIALMI